MKKIVVATGNQGKLREIREIFEGYPVEFLSMKDIWSVVPDIEENGTTFLENARIKADYVFDRTGIWTLADDSGLEVDYLNGAPGVRSARFAGEKADSTANNEKLLHELRNALTGQRTARFKCVIVLKYGCNTYNISEGSCEGKIAFELKGDGGFGYDPLFIPEGESLSFAEIGSEKKHQISHRGKALQQLKTKIHEIT